MEKSLYTLVNVIKSWIAAHPAKTASISGWYQQACGILYAVLTVPFILNKLSETDAGLWFAFQGFILAITLTDFGFSFVISRQVAHSLALASRKPTEIEGDFLKTSPGWQGISEVYTAGKTLFYRITFAGLILLIFLHEVVIPFTKLGPLQNWQTTLAWYLLGVAMLIALQTKLNQAILDGIGKMYITKATIGSFQLLNGIAVIISLFIYPALPVISLAILVVSAVQYIVIDAILKNFAGSALKPKKTGNEKELLSKLWKIAAPIGIVNSAGYFITTVQVPMAGALLGAKAVTPFYLAQRISNVFVQAVAQLSLPQMPLFTMEYSKGDFIAARKRMTRITLIAILSALVAFAVFYLFSPTIVELWVGSGRYVPDNVLIVISIDCFILSAVSVLAQFVLASGRNPFVYSTLINALFSIALTIILCPRLGLLGLPCATLVSGLLVNYWFSLCKGFELYKSLNTGENSQKRS